MTGELQAVQHDRRAESTRSATGGVADGRNPRTHGIDDCSRVYSSLTSATDRPSSCCDEAADAGADNQAGANTNDATAHAGSVGSRILQRR